MAKLLKLDPTKGFSRCECNDLEDFYRELGCETFDIATRKIGGTYYDMFVDDIGFFKPLHVSAIDKNCKPMLVGNIVFANHDDQGNTTDLSEEDIEKICGSVLFVGYENGEMGMVVECEY